MTNTPQPTALRGLAATLLERWPWLQRLNRAVRHRGEPTEIPPAPTQSPDEQRRLENRRLLDQEIRLETIEVKSQPTTLILEPATACNLKCPFCPTGGGYSGLAKERLQPDVFERIVSHLDVGLLEEVLLYNWGEPLLNPHLADYIRFFSERGILTEVSVNLSTRAYDDAFHEKLVSSGIDKIIVSIDGATQETYEKYRVGGNFDRVVTNMQGLSSAKQRLGRETPEVLFKMLLHRYNEHEVEDSRQIAEQCGATFLLDDKFWCPDEHREEWIARSVLATPEFEPEHSLGKSSEGVMSTFCRQLWDTVVVNADGAVLPCCLIYQKEHAVGNLAEQELSEIRNNQAMRALRSFVTDASLESPGVPNHCEGCASRWCLAKN